MTPVVLLILDGWGIAPKNQGNAIELANKQNFDRYWNDFAHTKLFAHGHYVGLPDNQVGNSEAGHMNIGAGRLIKQDSVLISETIADGRFKKNLAINTTIEHVLLNKSNMHVFGLVSDVDSPHSSLEHLYALVDLIFAKGIKNIYLHLITDGRDSPQYEAINILDKVEKNIVGKAKIVSLMGRFFAMDRGKNWDRTRKAYECLTESKGSVFKNCQEVVLHEYNRKINDEFIEPTIISNNEHDAQKSRVSDNDGFIFFNLRSDRARQLSKCFVQKDFQKRNTGEFKRKRVIKNLSFCAFTDFGPDLDHILTAFPSADIKNTLPVILRGKTQLYIAETEKYAHMTYFINGGYADPVNGELRFRVPSKVVKSYAQIPEMSVYEITKKVLSGLQKDQFEFIAINFANPDMVGHTGDLQATIKAIEHVDICLDKIARTVLRTNGTLIITADHGNAEKMIDEKNGEVWTSHTTNQVPFILINKDLKNIKLKEGKLGNIVPTIYELFGMEKLPIKLSSSLIK
ncbi:MAG: 2,3-bisphosphoglycerate-independent phosphoglycerate mutase [Patescibacteria group bacterium]